MTVHFSFTNGVDNVTKTNSYEYSSGKFLGKKDDDTALYWAAHSLSVSPGSADGFKQRARSDTVVTTSSTNLGWSHISFLPSAVGGDKFTLNAEVTNVGETNVLAKATSGEMTVWRKVSFKRIYEMPNKLHVRDNASELYIRPYFTDTVETYVEYELGTEITKIPSVKYVGLWTNDVSVGYQQDWSAIYAKRAYARVYTNRYGVYVGSPVNTEIPTQQELTDAEGTIEPDRTNARAAIAKKAQAWVERIDDEYRVSQRNWISDNGMTNAIASIQYHHPKYSECGESSTSEWPSWVVVATYRGRYQNVNPNSDWTLGSFFGGLQHTGTGLVSIPTGLAEGSIRRYIAHEAGHATRDFFNRQVFGSDLDHSENPGLMDRSSSQPHFNEREQKILRGMKVIP